ncbi:hypothetical protein EUTSA_v10009350mg [Eutrema salsugineum]|uniref:EF-hand domain-containing protein n=1 Tax=Eutrema salsugineum TaxID=72664 RepID=V4KRR0_EUTSA|nr:hypothetical protein EUTSA_v10009350mg [Eutrema salsugineum]
MARLALFLSVLSLSLTSCVNCRVLNSVTEKIAILVSDGFQDGSEHEFLSLDLPNRVSKNACIHVYGFLPCADNVAGYVFQVFSFGVLLMIGEYFLSEGRSKLFVIFEVGFYGGIVFPLLRIFPRIYFDKADQEKILNYARFEIMSEVHKHLQSFSPKTLLRDGQLSKETLKRLIDKFDVNKDGKIQISELKNMRVEFEKLGGMKCNAHELATTLLEYFDIDRDGEIYESEFEQGIAKWLKHYKFTFDNNECQSNEKHSLQEAVGVLKVEQPKESLFVKFFSKRTMRASTEVIVGIVSVMFLARPFMMNIEILSVSAGFPSFYVVFAVIPLVRNLKKALSAHFCRKKDKARITSDIL